MTKGLIAVLPAALLATAVASAQSYPGDLGLGQQRGIQQVNNSGEVGTVTLFHAGADTRVLVDLHGAAPDRVKSVRIYRGHSCESDIAQRPAFFLSDMRHGISRSIVRYPEDKLLAGNYNVIVFSSNTAGSRATACGHLYT